jgi:hypothetical protein
MDYGTAAVIIGAMASVVAVVLTKPHNDKTCPLHGGVADAQKELWDAISEIRTDMKTVLQRTAKL